MSTATNTKQLLNNPILFKVMTESVAPIQGSNGVSRYLVQGILQRANAKNHNGRVYPLDVLKREILKYEQTYIKENRAYGELDHPDSTVISAQNASHTVERIWWKGDEVWGELEILDTPAGNIVKNILKAKKTLGISSRGMGSVNTIAEGIDEVDDDFELIAFDFVTNPSTQGAFMRPVNEGRTYNNPQQTSKELNALMYDILNNLR